MVHRAQNGHLRGLGTSWGTQERCYFRAPGPESHLTPTAPLGARCEEGGAPRPQSWPLLSPTGSFQQCWGLTRVWGRAHHTRTGQQGRTLVIPKLAGIGLPWPQRWQVRDRQENLPREARIDSWSHWAADQGLFPGRPRTAGSGAGGRQGLVVPSLHKRPLAWVRNRESKAPREVTRRRPCGIRSS